MTIRERLERELPADPAGVEALCREIEAYLHQVDADMVDALQQRHSDNLDDSVTYRFFRSKVRNENIKYLMQYMTAFLDHLPEEATGSPIDPFLQFRQFVQSHADLLAEEDVRRAAMREYARLGLLNDSNRWYYEGRINDRCDEFHARLTTAVDRSPAGFCALFRVVQEVCLFWFEMRCENPQRVRRSDMLLFTLSGVLLRKYC